MVCPMAEQLTALVTGGGSGIGAATCHALARAGAHILVAGRNVERLEKTAADIRSAGGEAHALVMDVSEPASIQGAVQQATSLAGPVKWLVANAGVALSAPLDAANADELAQRQMDVNFHGARRVIEAFIGGMIGGGEGQVAVVASSAALQGYAYVSGYAASKHALLGYARCMALELNRKNVGVHAVCPHYVDTPMTAASIDRIMEKTGRSSEEARWLLSEMNPGGKLVQPDEVGNVIVELMQGSHTGEVIELTGSERRVIEPGSPLGAAPPQGETNHAN